MILANDEPLQESALLAQLTAIDFKLMIARINDQQNNDIKLRIDAGLTIEQADQILIWLEQFIDRDFRSATDINIRVKRKLNDGT